MMRKKLLSFAFIATMGLSLVACGGAGAKSVSNEYIKVNNYNKLQILKVDTEEVTDEEVQAQIDAELENAKTTKEVERAAKEGDIANIDYTGKIKGKTFDGGSAEAYDLELGSNTFIGAEGKYKGFEEQIIGHKAGDEFSIEVKFPESYSGDMAGKVATFEIKLNTVSVYEDTELTDEWVQENSTKSKTVDEYKAQVKEEITKSNEESAHDTLQTEVLEALQKQIEVIKVPEKEAKELKEELVNQYKSYATSYGMEFADFLEQGMGMTEKQFNEEAQKVAEQSAEVYMACELIAGQEKLTPTDAQYTEEYAKLAKQYGFESGEDFIEQYGEEEVKKSVLQEKVVDYLIEHAQQLSEEEMSKLTESTTAAEGDTASEATTQE